MLTVTGLSCSAGVGDLHAQNFPTFLSEELAQQQIDQCAGDFLDTPHSPSAQTAASHWADDREASLDGLRLVHAESFAQPLPRAGQVPLPAPNDPILSSGQAPFQIPPGTTTGQSAANQNDYLGHDHIQDLSSLLPGTFKETKYKWYGFVRLDSIFDFAPIGSTDDFVTSSIPIPQGRGQNYAITPRYTRLGWDTETPLDSLDWTIRTRIEVDFFNGNTSGAFGSFPLRLRFAWVDFGPFLIGQAASLFMDYDVFPNVIDYEGPPGMVLVRQPLIAVRLPLGDRFKFSFGVEQPYSDIQWFDGGGFVVNPGSGVITTAGAPRNVQDVPDLTGNLRYNGDYGHTQLAGIARKLTYQPSVGPDESVFGYGLNLTGTWHPWAQCRGRGSCADGQQTPLEKSRFLGQFAAGKGINRYMADVNGLGLDAVFDPVNGFDAVPSLGWFIAYEQWWADKWISTFSYSQTDSNLSTTLPGNTYQSATYATANLIWLPVPRMGVGIEYLHGTRENQDGQSGTAQRIQLGFQYKF